MTKRKPAFTDPAYRFGHDPIEDLFLIGEMLRGNRIRSLLNTGAPWKDANRQAGETARDLIANPFQVPVDRLANGPDANLGLLRLAYIWPGGKSSLQALLARDDQDRYSVVTVLNGAPIKGERGRHGMLWYGVSEHCRDKRARIPQPDALLDPLERLGGAPGMTFWPMLRPLLRGARTLSPVAYAKHRNRRGASRMWVEVHDDIRAARQPETLIEELGSAVRYGSLQTGQVRARVLASIKQAIGLPQLSDTDLEALPSQLEHTALFDLWAGEVGWPFT